VLTFGFARQLFNSEKGSEGVACGLSSRKMKEICAEFNKKTYISV
jgi:hypothetical protein